MKILPYSSFCSTTQEKDKLASAPQKQENITHQKIEKTARAFYGTFMGNLFTQMFDQETEEMFGGEDGKMFFDYAFPFLMHEYADKKSPYVQKLISTISAAYPQKD